MAAIYHGALLAVYLVALRPSASGAMVDFWEDRFVDVSGLGELFVTALHGTLSLGRHSLPEHKPMLAVFALLFLLGLYGLITRREIKWLALICLSCASIIVANALRIYPLGAARTDLFFVPLPILVIVFGCRELLRRLDREWAKGLVVGAFAATVLVISPRSYGYVPVDEARAVRDLETRFRPDAGDGLLIQPFGAMALSYYGGWDCTLRRSTLFAHGFQAVPEIPASYLIPEGKDGVEFRDNPSLLAPFVDAALETGHRRLVYFTIHSSASFDSWLEEYIKRDYRLSDVITIGGRPKVWIFVRLSP